MKNFNRIRGIMSAKNGTQIPKFQNPAGSINLGNPSKIESKIIPFEARKPGIPEIKTETKINPNVTNIASTVGTVADTARSLLFSKQHAKNSELTQGLNTAYDATSSALMTFAPVGTIVGGAMKVGALVGDGLNAIGVGTDQMTTADKILDSNFLKLTPVGLINSAFTDKTQDFSIDQNVSDQIGSSYVGSLSNLQKADEKAGKKYGLFSASERKKADQLINKSKIQQSKMSSIADKASDLNAMTGQDFNYRRYLNNQQGGYNQRLMRAAKHGSKIDFVQDDIELNSRIDLNSQEWVPIIQDPIVVNEWVPIIQEFKEGGNLEEINEWTPIISELQEPVIEDIIEQTISEFKDGGSLASNEWIPEIVDIFQKGGSVKPSFEEWFAEIERKHRNKEQDWKSDEYDFKLAYETFPDDMLINYMNDPFNNNLNSLHEIDNGDGTYNYKFIKLGKDSKEVWKQLSQYYLGEDEVKPWTHRLEFNPEENRYYFISNKSKKSQKPRDINELIKEAKKQNPRFIQRMSEPLRYVRVNHKDDEGLDYYTTGTHEMAYNGNTVFSMIQDIDGKLKRFTDFDKAYESALKHNNVIRFNNEEEAKLFSESDVNDKGEFFGYKKGWPEFFKLNHLYVQPDTIINEWEEIDKFKEGGKTQENNQFFDMDSVKDFYKDYDLSNVNIIYDKNPRTEGNSIYANSDESLIHELWHYLSKNAPNELYKDYYNNLNDDKIINLGGDLNFVKRFENDPGHFYHPSELEARVRAAKFKTNGKKYTQDFFKELRQNENTYGDNMRDLLHMYNDSNLEKIFNLKNGGLLKEFEVPEIKETTQKNIIPEGALHKNKHYIEHTEGLTQKGIPVVDNDGNQQAEVECEEIIFTLEVTKALEERYHKYYSDDITQKEKDELAIEVGKLLVKEILYNTDDRAQLIDKCKKGGKL